MLDFYLELEQLLESAILLANHDLPVVSVMLLVQAAERIELLERMERVAFGPRPPVSLN